MAAKAKVTKLRLQIPKGMKVEDLVQKLEISFEAAEAPHTGAATARWNENYCCVDAAVVGPFSTISENGGGGGDEGTA